MLQLLGFIIISAFWWVVIGATTVVFFVYCDFSYNFLDVHLYQVFDGILRSYKVVFGEKINVTVDVSKHDRYTNYMFCKNKRFVRLSDKFHRKKLYYY